MRIQRTVRTSATPEQVFDYLSDFTTTTQWDPGTVKTTRLSGDGGVGTTYRNISSFRGRETELTYTVVDHDRPHRFALRGENATLTADDVMTFAPDSTGTYVTYTAEFTFKGLARFFAPFLGSAFTQLGDAAEKGMREAFEKLPANG
jgi:carbon monoxide dehydrogenase subunit G